MRKGFFRLALVVLLISSLVMATQIGQSRWPPPIDPDSYPNGVKTLTPSERFFRQLVIIRYYKPDENSGRVVYSYLTMAPGWSSYQPGVKVIDERYTGFESIDTAVNFACYNARLDKEAGFEVEMRGIECPPEQPDDWQVIT